MSDYEHLEDILSQEAFLCWYFKDDAIKAREWEAWMNANPSKRYLVDEAVAFLKALPSDEQSLSHETVEIKLAALHTKLHPAKNSRTIKMRRLGWMAAAASVLLIISFFVFNRYNVPQTHLSAPFAQTSTDVLPDGSVVILNANSNIHFAKNWDNTADREVWLEGEAFFKVTKTSDKKRFIVHSGEFDVLVTGTQFNVTNRKEHQSVYLAEGSVILKDKTGTELKMVPGDYTAITNGIAQPAPARPDQILAWKDNKISFSNTPLTQVITQIADHYGVSIEISGPELKDKSLTGIMPNNNLDDLLKAIQLAIDVRVTKMGDKIILSDSK